jgi:predicted histidine transporter YuiF (NhaC family)
MIGYYLRQGFLMAIFVVMVFLGDGSHVQVVCSLFVASFIAGMTATMVIVDVVERLLR